MAIEQPVSRAALQVVGICGQTVEVVVGGAVVSFTCFPAATQTSEQPLPALKAGHIEAPNTALVTEINMEGLDPQLLVGPDQLEPGSEPLVVNVKAGGQIAASDFSDDLASAGQAGRAVWLKIK